MSQLFASGGQSIGDSASASVLPMNIQAHAPQLLNLCSRARATVVKAQNPNQFAMGALLQAPFSILAVLGRCDMCPFDAFEL